MERMDKMGITLLMGFLFGAVTVSGIYRLEKREKQKQDKKIKWKVLPGLFLGIFGMLLGMGISADVGKKIAEKYLTSTPVTVLETVNLSPFSGSSEAYIVIGENQRDEKVACFWQENGELFEEPCNNIIDRNMIVFTNDTVPAKQLVKVNVGSFWKWFALVPNKYRFVIPAKGLQKGKILKTYKFIPVSE